MLYSRLVSDEAEVIPAYYLEQYQKEGGCLDAWELPWRTYSPQFHSFQEMVVHGPQDKPEAVQEALGDSVKKYYAFYCPLDLGPRELRL